VLAEARGQCDLVLHDAFSPGHCPQLWSLEFLGQLASALQPQGRLLTYCSAAAVRGSLRQAGLELANLAPGPLGGPDEATSPAKAWSNGTVASPQPLPPDPTGLVQPLSAMEEAHLASRAAEPYRDPTGRAEASAILAARQRTQASHPGISTSAWRRQWGLDRRANGPPPPAGPSNGR
jgi:tRNA U34 5-methylaminomethyl-2-thiouridine-forming methyltransferase MnmC